MFPFGLVLKLIIIIQITNIVKVTFADYENYIAFNCGRPTLIFQKDKWIRDYDQNCISDEGGIVAYCKKTFSNKNISSAEPAMDKIKINKWCDFGDKNCEDIEIRPFKCLEMNFQSDALTLPKDCLFAHLGGQGDCKIYKDWIVSARTQCSLKPNWRVKSYGMLFQCGPSKDKVKPMFFKGIEFVCCPPNVPVDSPKDNFNSQAIYGHYLSNGVLETEEGEDRTYGDALKEMKQSHSMLRKNIVDDFIKGELDLEKLWKSDKKLAEYKENILISAFKTAYNALEDQFMANKEQLLDFHDDRRKFLFNTKMSAAMRRFEEIFKNPNANKMEVINVVKDIFELLLNRKNEILEEQNGDKLLGSHLLLRLASELKLIEKNITDLFQKLDQLPQNKKFIKNYLDEYIMNKATPKNVTETVKSGISKLTEIISKYKHRSDDDNDESSVHYDLGLDDEDQKGHHGNSEQRNILDRDAMEKQFGDKKLLFTLVFGTLLTAFVVLIAGSIVLMYRHRSRLFKYSKTTLDDQGSGKQMMHGFGIESSSVGKDMINGTPFNGYENPTYKVIQTSLDTSTQVAKVHDNPSSPLMQS